MSLEAVESRIHDIVAFIYERDYLPVAKEVHDWVVSHEAEYHLKLTELVETIAAKHLDPLGNFDEDFASLKAEIKDAFAVLHDDTVGQEKH